VSSILDPEGAVMLARVHLRRRITDAEIERVSRDNPGWQVEREADGSLVMSPNAARTSPKNVELVVQLAAYAKKVGGKAFGPDAGFTMPDKALLSPDGSWISHDRWWALSDKERDSYSPIVPDICVELVSKSDAPLRVRRKVEGYRKYGARYAVMIDPDRRESWSYGEPPPGFALELEAIYDA
jgi:Uma2 family endonuclease